MITTDEQDFVRRVAQRFQVSYKPLEVGPVSGENSVSEAGRASAILRALPSDTQARVLALLVESAVTDGDVDPTEHALLLVAAAAFGIDAAALEERIASRLRHVTAG